MGWYANLKIRNKLALVFGVVLIAYASGGYYGLVGLSSMEKLLTDMYHDNLESVVELTELRKEAYSHHNLLYDLVLETDTVEMDRVKERMDNHAARILNLFEEHGKREHAVSGEQLKKKFEASWQAYMNSVKRVIPLGYNNDKKAISLLHNDTDKAFNLLVDVIDEMVGQHRASAQKEDESGDALYFKQRGSLIGLFLFFIIFCTFLAFYNTKVIVAPLRLVREYAQRLTEGSGEKIRIVEAIAAGDLSKDIIVAEKLSVDPRSLTHDEAGELLAAELRLSEMQSSLDVAFAKMTSSLRANRTQEQDRDWLKTGLNELNALMRGEPKAEEMADKILTFLAEYLKAGAGAFYLFDDKGQSLLLTATYAFTRRKNLSDRFRLGEGVIGQAALEKKTICLLNIPPDYLQIGSALGEAVPQNIVALPLLHDGQLVAALELGTFRPFSDKELDFLNQAMEGIAIGLGVSHSRQRINELLEQTQQQTEELRVQQEELQQTNEELEERAEMLEQQRAQIQAKNREIETASDEVRRKAEEFEKVSAYKSEFLANMSHELRTPLNSVMILSGLLTEDKEGTMTDKQKEFAATINSAGKDLLNLINDILDLSKVEAGRLELVYEEIAVSEFREAIEGMFRQQAEQRGLDFSIIVEESVPETIRIDEQRTEQIVKNLLSNAFKFTEKGSVTFTISAPADTTHPLPAPAVAFRVTDTGIGIEKEKHELVFQAFQQVDGSTSRKFGGTGLGLSISLQLAQRMGGDITLESERGKGSTFTLYLPLTGQNRDEQATAPTALQPSEPVMPAVKGHVLDETAGSPVMPSPLPDDRNSLAKGDKSILIIEDDLNFARTLMTMVREKGFGCIVTADGTSGLHLADLYSPSAVILDVMLPGMDGWSVMRSLKDNPATRHIPVHFITCLDERQKGMSMGAVGFFTKPVTPEQLEEVFGAIEKNVTKSMRRLLIIEDDATEAESMAGLLQERNLEITVAGSGRDATDILGRGQIDCIVLDLGLPDMSGFDLLEHIHRSEKLRSIPVIIHTGRDLSHEEELKLRHYAKSIIIKGAKGPERLLNEVTLFLHMVESELPSEKQKMIRAALDKEAMLEGKKVLLVDDDMRNVFSLSSILTDKNMIVLEAENGKEALVRLAEHPDINIVLMDIMMPEMDGYEAIRTIRLDPRFRSLPIIAMTAKAMAGDQEKCIQAGANDYISKPLDMGKFLSLLRVWLYRQE